MPDQLFRCGATQGDFKRPTRSLNEHRHTFQNYLTPLLRAQRDQFDATFTVMIEQHSVNDAFCFRMLEDHIVDVGYEHGKWFWLRMGVLVAARSKSA